MQPSIAYAVPFFFLLIAVEFVFARWKGRRGLRIGAAFSDLGCGVTQQVVFLFAGPFLLGAHEWVYERARLFDISGPVAWAVAVPGVDFFYYWWHRASHRVRALWAAHVVHHQSEDMNLAVALRQSPLNAWTGLPFFLPLTLLGVPPSIYFGASAINALYQFWIHTELLPSLGPLEWVLNTPSHHRGHHGINPRYIDKNYGGITIIWDRLFGTFAKEEEPVVYGTTTPLKSFDPLWAQIQPWVAMAQEAWRAPRLLDKVQLWLRPPEWAPGGVLHAARPVTPETRPNWDIPLSGWVAAVVFALVVLAVSGTVFLLVQSSLPRGQVALGGGLILLALLAGGRLLEAQRTFAVGAETPSADRPIARSPHA
jgi:sterol desaturase/sphingolipid hydroxylase (fatty acid hydroxylase superfamily)